MNRGDASRWTTCVRPITTSPALRARAYDENTSGNALLNCRARPLLTTPSVFGRVDESIDRGGE
jgi:hypothetical protein